MSSSVNNVQEKLYKYLEKHIKDVPDYGEISITAIFRNKILVRIENGSKDSEQFDVPAK
jgi:hypothetical protein